MSFRRSASVMAAVALGALASASPARADEATAAVCIRTNEQAGPLRRAGKLREARASFRECSAEGCPTAVRKDCLEKFAELEGDVPKIAFSAQDADGNDLVAVKVTVDGHPFADQLDGKALEVDPGEHVFRFEAPGEPAVEKRLVLIEGDQKRRERIEIGGHKSAPSLVVVPAAPTPPQPAPATGRRRTAALVTGAAGLGLLAVGGAAAVAATLEWAAAKNDCGAGYPATCADRADASFDRSATLAAGTIADVTLVLGGAALVTGATLLLLPPPGGAAASAGGARGGGGASGWLVLTPQLGPSTTGLVLRGSF